MGDRDRPLSPAESAVVERLRAITRQLPEVVIYRDGFGHSTCRVGKRSFVIVGADATTVYVTIKADLITQDALVRRGVFERASHIGQHGWVTAAVSPALDWAEVEDLVIEAYCRVAPKRLLRSLEAREGRSAR
ncbi:MAG: MmcQ/YjbR family DNA-binding protein [Longimicrobiales bacterium]